MSNIVLLINCHYRYVTTNFRIARSVKCLHSITHSFTITIDYHYSYIILSPSLSLVLLSYASLVQIPKTNMSNGNQNHHPLIFIACGWISLDFQSFI